MVGEPTAMRYLLLAALLPSCATVTTETIEYDELISTDSLPWESPPQTVVSVEFEEQALLVAATTRTECWLVHTERRERGTLNKGKVEGVWNDIIYAGLLGVSSVILVTLPPTDPETGDRREKTFDYVLAAGVGGLGLAFLGDAISVAVRGRETKTDVTQSDKTTETARRTCSDRPIKAAQVFLETPGGASMLGSLDSDGRARFRVSDIQSGEIRQAILAGAAETGTVIVNRARTSIALTRWRDALITEEFASAAALGTAEALEGFVGKYPASVHERPALAKLAAVYWPDVAASGSVQRLTEFAARFAGTGESEAALSMAASIEFARLKPSGTPDELLGVWNKYPSTAFGTAAADLAEKRAWERLRGSTNVELHQTYLSTFPQGKHADEVRTRLDAVEARAERAELARLVRGLPGVLQRCNGHIRHLFGIAAAIRASLDAGNYDGAERLESQGIRVALQLCSTQNELVEIIDALEGAGNSVVAISARQSGYACLAWECP